MAEKIERVLADEALQAKLIAEGFKRVQRYSWEKMARQTHGIYMMALERRK